MSGEWLHIIIPRDVQCRFEDHWGEKHIYLRVGDNFDRRSVGEALLTLAFQAIREETLREEEV